MKLSAKILFTAFFILGLCFQMQAQNSVKEMDKKTKAELKEFMKDPASYRKKIKNYDEQIESYEVQLSEVQEDFYKADYLRVLYYDSIQELHEQMKNMTASVVTNTIAETGGQVVFKTTGTDYRVQIGAYRYFDFTKLLEFNQPIGYEKVNGIIHYFLGSWDNADAAYEFTKAIRKLKIKDAFVTKYVDGKRVPYDHIVEGGGLVVNQ
jgi:hypothetical protein